MITINEKSQCCGCSACVQSCPVQCIAMQADDEGFSYPVADAEQCIQCGKCEKVCPILHAVEDTKVVPDAWAVINTDEEIRKTSSSGGIFSLLAEQVIAEGGVIFGAAFDADFAVVHKAVDTAAGLESLRGSKYTQSRMGTVCQEVDCLLKAGRKVLFSGTPCQIEGLRTYLGRDDEQLLLVDIICHGVPSPKVWQEYIKYREKKNKSSSRRIFFRHKKYGWKRYAVSFSFENDTAYLGPLDRDLFMQAFLTDICLRPSCGQCAFKKTDRISDITLADFWGIEHILPSMDDDRGTSLVLVHSSKGRNLLDAVSAKCRMQRVESSAALRCNPAMTLSAEFHKNRSVFFKNLGLLPFDQLVRRYATRRYSWKTYIAIILRKFGLLEIVKKMLYRASV